MTTSQIIGALIIASPFVVLLIFTIKELGLWESFVIFGGTLGLLVLMGVGSYLLAGPS